MKSFVVLLFFCLPLSAKEIMTLGNAAKVAQTPEDCIDSEGVCAIKTGPSEKYRIKIGNSQVVLDENTAIIRQDEFKLVLVTGQVWVLAKDEIKIETEYGSARTHEGNFLCKNKDKRMEVKAIDAIMTLTPRLSKTELSLEPGEQNWLGRIDQNRVTSSGVPVAVSPSELISGWARLYTGTKSQFENDFKNFFEQWQNASVNLAKLHAEITQRQIAGIEHDRTRKKHIEEEKARETKRIKDWFRQKSLAD